ncbi:MAG: acyltransferase family protein [Blautia sp.]|nr:acyltransferase family protein [Lachnoclostridium sp.]MCM1210862.1 acyltransferase family protein [Blautia sp.]
MSDNKGKHLSAIDIIKGIAIWMIILVHSRQKIPDLSPWLKFFDLGQMGCQMFFVISGFSSMLSYERISRQPKPAWAFYRKRLSTIIPGWYAMIGIVYLLNTLSLAVSGETIGFANNRNPIAILCNLLLLQGLLPFCNNNVSGGGGTLALL